MPKSTANSRSGLLPATVYAPMKQTTTIIGPMMANGTRRIAAKIGTVDSTSTTATMLATYMLAISPQTKSGRSTKSVGPGFSPQIISPPSITADVAEPGTPSASIGSMALVPAAGSAGWGATMPPGPPVPKVAPRDQT